MIIVSLKKAYKHLKKAQESLQELKGKIVIKFINQILNVQTGMYDFVTIPVDPVRLKIKMKDQQVFDWYKDYKEREVI